MMDAENENSRRPANRREHREKEITMEDVARTETSRKHWLRLWHDMPTDPKFRVIARRSGRPLAEVISVFVLMLTNASANASERGVLNGWDDEDVAAALDMEPEHVTAICDAMQGKVLDYQKLQGWEKRQPKREDGSAERAKAWRERKRTQSERPEEIREEKRREEKNILPTYDHGITPREADRPSDDQNFTDCKQAFNGTTEAMLSEVMTAMQPYGDRKGAAQWLATTMRTNGADATAQAFQILATAKAEGQVIARVLPWWAKTAATVKASGPKAKPVAVETQPKKSKSEIERETKAFFDKAMERALEGYL